MDIFFVAVATEHQFEFWCRHSLPDYVYHIIPYNPFGRGEVANTHLPQLHELWRKEEETLIQTNLGEAPRC